jgi:MATE family multidrug resistance protein
VAASGLRARGDNWFPTFSHIAAYAVVMPVLGYWLAEHEGMGVAGLLFAIFWASVLSAAVLLVRWWALERSKKSEIGNRHALRAASPRDSGL